MKRIIISVLLTIMLIFSINVIASASTLRLSKQSVTVGVGKTVTLKATVSGISKKVTWQSANKKIATVSSKGVVKGIKAGTTTVIAKANGITARCKITVKKTVKDVSLYMLKPLSKVFAAFPAGYKEGTADYYCGPGLHFRGGILSYSSSGLSVTQIDVQNTTGYSLNGVVPGVTKSSALKIMKKKGWKIKSNSIKNGDGTVCYSAKGGYSGKGYEIYMLIKKNRVSVISACRVIAG